MPVWKFFQPCGYRHEMDANNVTEALDLPRRESGASHHGQAASAGFLADRDLNQVGIAILMIDLKRLRWQYQAKGRIRCLTRPGNGPVRLELLPALNRNMRKAVARSSRYDTSPNRLCHTQRVILHPAPDPEVPASEGGMKEGGGAVDLGLFQHLLAGGQAVGDGLHLTAVGPIHLLPGQPVLPEAVVGDFIFGEPEILGRFAKVGVEGSTPDPPGKDLHLPVARSFVVDAVATGPAGGNVLIGIGQCQAVHAAGTGIAAAMLAAAPSPSVTTLSFPGPRDTRKNTRPVLSTGHSSHAAELFPELLHLHQVNTHRRQDRAIQPVRPRVQPR